MCFQLGPSIGNCSLPLLLCHFCVAPMPRCRRRFCDSSVLFVCHTATSALFVFAQRSQSEITNHAFLITHGAFLELCLIRLKRLCVDVFEQITANLPNICVLQSCLSTTQAAHGNFFELNMFRLRYLPKKRVTQTPPSTIFVIARKCTSSPMLERRGAHKAPPGAADGEGSRRGVVRGYQGRVLVNIITLPSASHQSCAVPAKVLLGLSISNI